MKKFLFFIMLVLSVAGCTSTQHVRLDTQDSKSPTIDIYLLGEQEPTKEYEIISYIETSGAIFTTKKQLMRGLKRNADKIGADALIQVKYFYIPHLFSGLPAVDGIAVKYKK